MNKLFVLGLMTLYLVGCSCPTPTIEYKATIVSLLETENKIVNSMQETLDAISNTIPTEEDAWCAGDCLVIMDYYQYLEEMTCYKAWELLSDNYQFNRWKNDVGAFCYYYSQIDDIDIISFRLVSIYMPYHYIEVVLYWNLDKNICLFSVLLSPLPRWEIDGINCMENQ